MDSSLIGCPLLSTEPFVPELNVATCWSNWDLVDLVSHFFLVLIVHHHLLGLCPLSHKVSCTTIRVLLQEKSTRSFTFLAGLEVILEKLINELLINSQLLYLVQVVILLSSLLIDLLNKVENTVLA